MLKHAVLIFESDKFLLVTLEEVDFFFEVSNNDVPLVGFDLEGGVEVGRTLGAAHLAIKSIN